MRLVIIGTGGRVGGALARHFRLRGHEVMAFDRKALDLARPEIIDDRLLPLAFEAVLLPAALTSLDVAEDHPAQARVVNALGPARVAEICAQRQARLIHFSTDYVYDGSRPGWRMEEEPLHPLGVYAQTKAEGERLVLDRTEGAALIARVSWVFGPDRPAFPDQILEQARRGESLAAVADKFSTPTSSADLARWLESFVVGEHRGVGGVVNFCHAGLASWQEYAQVAVDIAARRGVPLQQREVRPLQLADMSSFRAPRPVHTAMSLQKLTDLRGTRPRAWQEALEEYIATYYAPR